MTYEIGEIDIEILKALTFAERFDMICEEVKAPQSVIKDCIKQLIDQRFIKPVYNTEKAVPNSNSFMYDGDEMDACLYIATKKGLTLVEPKRNK